MSDCEHVCQCKKDNLPPNSWCPKWQRFVPPVHRDACSCDPGIDPERAESYRKFLADHPHPDAKPPEPMKMPGLLQQAVNYAKSTAAWAAGGFNETTPAEKARRMSICHACPFLNREEMRCSVCGCPIDAKTSRATESCPPKTPGGPRWLPEVVTHRNPFVKLSDEEDLRYDGNDIAGIDNLATEPTFYDSNGEAGSHADLTDRTAVLICGGPSLTVEDLAKLPTHYVTMCLNNVGQFLTTDFWVCIDSPASKFPEDNWENPSIRKLVPRALAQEALPSGKLVKDCPNVSFFIRNYRFRSSTFLTEPTFCVGNEAHQTDELGIGGTRSVMFAAIKALIAMHTKNILILGADFHMNVERPYSHNETKDENAVKHSNVAFRNINLRFQALRPRIEMAGVRIINATPHSGLTAFESMPLDNALALF